MSSDDAPTREPGRLRIAMVAACPFPCPRGTPIRVERMSEALADRGHDVHVITYHLSQGEAQGALTVHRTPDVPSYTRLAPGPSPRKLLQMDPLLVRTLRRVLRDHSFDVVHAHHVEGLASALLARIPGLPIVFDAHTLLESELPFYLSGLPRKAIGRLGRVLDGGLGRRADHVVAVTPAIRDALVASHGLDADRVTVVENGVEWARFSGRRQPSDARTIVFAGGLTPYQGIETLLEAMRFLGRTHPDARLVLAVEDEHSFAPYRDLAGTLGLDDVVAVRRTDLGSLPDVLGRATLGVNPRPACHGQPLKLLNYLAAGLPIVSSVGSSKGLVHAETAWIVPDDDPVGLAKGLAHLLDDPNLAERLGAEGRARIQRRPTWAGVAEKSEDIYARLIGAA